MKLKNKIILTVARFTRKHSFKGMQRIINFIFPPSNENKISTVIDDYDGDLKINIDTSSFIEWITFFKGYYEPEVTRLIKEILNPGGVAVDVGANVGIHTLVMAKEVGNKGKIYAFEPHPHILKRLKDNIMLNCFRSIVDAIQKGLSNTEGEFNFFIHDDRRINKGNSTLYEYHFKGELHKKIKIKVEKLDDFVKNNRINKINLIKVDTEGNDFNVLKGAGKTIRDHKPCIIFEYERKSWSLANDKFEDAYNFLNSKKYKLYKIKKRKLKVVDTNNFDNSMMVFAKFEKNHELQR